MPNKLNLISSFLVSLHRAIMETIAGGVCVCLNRLQIGLDTALNENYHKHVATCFFHPTAFWSLDLWQMARRNQVTMLSQKSLPDIPLN